MKVDRKGGWKALMGLALISILGSALQLEAANPVPQRISIDPGSPPGNGTHYVFGETILIRVDFDIPIDVANAVVGSSPYLDLSISPADNNRAVYDGHSGTNLFLTYTVQAGDYASPLAYPNNTSLRLAGTTVIYDAAGAPGNFGDRWNRFSNRIPAPGAANALDADNAQIRTLTLTPATASILEGQTQVYTISRGGPRALPLTVNLDSSNTSTAVVPGSTNIPANAASVQFSVVGYLAGSSTITADAYPALPSASHETSALTVNPGPTPTFNISVPAFLYEGPSLDIATYPYSDDGTVRLSRPAQAAVTIGLTSSDPTALEIMGAGSVTFAAGEQVKTFPMEGRDGDANVTITGVDGGGTYVSDGATAIIAARNVPPVLDTPPEDWEIAPGAEGNPVTISWSGRDVTADMSKLEARITYGDGFTTAWLPGASGSDTHIYSLAGQFSITVDLRDTDGGIVSQSAQIEIAPATQVLITEIVEDGPVGYQGLPGLGDGTIDDTITNGPPRLPVPGTFHTWTIKYNPLQPSVVMLATPTNVDVVVEGVTNTYDSFFHVWMGEGFTDPGRLIPIANPAARLDLAGTDRDIAGVFSREFLVEDNYADIDQDGLPDQWEELWWPGQLLFETPNPQDNPDGDFLPRVSDDQMAYPAGGVGDFTPDGIAFGNIFEVRGLHEGLNAVDSDPVDPVDEPHYDPDPRDFFGTDPTNPDTDGDGLNDGWEYYFWMNATVNAITGLRFDPVQIITSTDLIPSDVIAAQFHPLVPSGEGDTDADGISDLEEYALGTNPIMWDSDGDSMADGWEVFRGLDPSTGDAAGNPDGDYMAAGFHAPAEKPGYVLRNMDPLTPLLFNVHFEVYDSLGYDPRTAWGGQYTFRNRGGGSPQPDTTPMLNIDEYALLRYWIINGRIGAAPAGVWGDFSTSPLSNDTDGDGAPDGWELYVHFDPCEPLDGSPLFDIDFDGLALGGEFNGQECTEASGGTVTLLGAIGLPIVSTNGPGTTNTTPAVTNISVGGYSYSESVAMVNANDRWWNKFWPCDPNNGDTDGDFTGDGTEQATFAVGPFQYTPPADWNQDYIRGARAGGGLNPTCVDTDMDFIPDAWEVQYRYDRVSIVDSNGVATLVPGMDGSIFDSKSGITLLNTNTVYDYDSDGLDNYQEYYVNAMWHFNYDKWQAGNGAGGYPAGGLFFGNPLHWDWAIAANYWEIEEGAPPPFHVPFVFIIPEPRPLVLLYASSDPSNWDTDFDGMDDHYEMFYGLNPLWSETADFIAKGAPARIADIRVQPWTAGEALADPDQDGLPNWEEAIFPSRPAPMNHNTDPSPYWVTDTSYEESWVNLYYVPDGHSWWWPPSIPGDPPEPYPSVFLLNTLPPTYVYSFANDEGFDTDNDNIADRMEVTGADQIGTSDPGFFDSPRLRKALYLDGESATRTKAQFSHELNQLRSWTAELWVRPEAPISQTGERQVVLERPLQGVDTDPTPEDDLVRRTFRIGLEPNGMPFAEYDNMGNNLHTESIAAEGWILQTNEWYHIAATMDGLEGLFSIYVNGILASRRPSDLIPATGIIDGNPPLVIPAPIVVGAAERKPNGVVHTTTPGVLTSPDLHLHFKGWSTLR